MTKAELDNVKKSIAKLRRRHLKDLRKIFRLNVEIAYEKSQQLECKKKLSLKKKLEDKLQKMEEMKIKRLGHLQNERQLRIALRIERLQRLKYMATLSEEDRQIYLKELKAQRKRRKLFKEKGKQEHPAVKRIRRQIRKTKAKKDFLKGDILSLRSSIDHFHQIREALRDTNKRFRKKATDIRKVLLTEKMSMSHLKEVSQSLLSGKSKQKLRSLGENSYKASDTKSNDKLALCDIRIEKAPAGTMASKRKGCKFSKLKELGQAAKQSKKSNGKRKDWSSADIGPPDFHSMRRSRRSSTRPSTHFPEAEFQEEKELANKPQTYDQKYFRNLLKSKSQIIRQHLQTERQIKKAQLEKKQKEAQEEERQRKLRELETRRKRRSTFNKDKELDRLLKEALEGKFNQADVVPAEMPVVSEDILKMSTKGEKINIWDLMPSRKIEESTLKETLEHEKSSKEEKKSSKSRLIKRTSKLRKIKSHGHLKLAKTTDSEESNVEDLTSEVTPSHLLDGKDGSKEDQNDGEPPIKETVEEEALMKSLKKRKAKRRFPIRRKKFLEILSEKGYDSDSIVICSPCGINPRQPVVRTGLTRWNPLSARIAASVTCNGPMAESRLRPASTAVDNDDELS
ncbi:trichohyalin-like [Stomoxys calcitrans]|uniref:trichohyalin-like n=1 Tax=Stomoxys calcitrans TaxID=35570 RepID=UPI0027E363B4|nr:trichohyalin-like [Stomoxys calcitrans]